MRKSLLSHDGTELYEVPRVATSFMPRLMGAGLFATLLMTLVAYTTPLIGVPNVDFAGLLGSFFAGEPPGLFASAWWAGMGWHLVNGSVVFPLIYAFWVYPVLGETRSAHSVQRGFYGHPVVRAVGWSLMLWAFCQAFAMPMAGAGIFSRNAVHPFLVLTGALLAHLVYGLTFGLLTREKKENLRTLELIRERAA